jgi:superfamily II DNA or RNA helicase
MDQAGARLVITLRPYQDALVADIKAAMRRHKRVLAVSPTGSGKTILLSSMASRVAAKGKRITVLVHRDELVDQVSDTLSAFNVAHGVLARGRRAPPSVRVVVASVFTLVRQLAERPAPDLLVVDEAHHLTVASTWGKVMAACPKAFVLGVTATPYRLSGEGLRQSFDEMVLGPTVRELIDMGSLADYRIFAPKTVDMTGMHKRGGDFVRGELGQRVDKPSITGDVIGHYKRLADGLPAVAFCVSVEHAGHVAQQFRDAGYRAVSIDGGMDRDVRRQVVADFKAGRINVLTSCDLISEGFDMPGIHVGILLRPTMSLGLHLQQIGRVLRVSPGKERALILDHAGNTFRHGLPDDERDWSLEGDAARKRKASEDEPLPLRLCKQCFAVLRVSLSACPQCGTPVVVQSRKVDQQEGTLEEVEASVLRRERAREQGQAATLEQLIEVGKRRGFRNAVGWAKHVFDARRRRVVA